VELQELIPAEEFASNAVARALAALFKTIEIPNDRLDIVNVSTPNMTILLCPHYYV
jgi:hypothetical protein